MNPHDRQEIQVLTMSDLFGKSVGGLFGASFGIFGDPSNSRTEADYQSMRAMSVQAMNQQMAAQYAGLADIYGKHHNVAQRAAYFVSKAEWEKEEDRKDAEVDAFIASLGLGTDKEQVL